MPYNSFGPNIKTGMWSVSFVGAAILLAVIFRLIDPDPVVVTKAIEDMDSKTIGAYLVFGVLALTAAVMVIRSIVVISYRAFRTPSNPVGRILAATALMSGSLALVTQDLVHFGAVTILAALAAGQLTTYAREKLEEQEHVNNSEVSTA